MKKILSLVLVLVAIAQANANEVDPKSPVGMAVVKNGAIVKLFYRGEQSGKVKVTIYNHKGDVVFKEVMQETEHFMRPYNFASLPEGQYTIELNDASGKRFHKVTHAKPKEKRVVYVTRLNQGGNKYMLAVRNDEKDVLTVRIYNHKAMIFEETQRVDGDFARVYNLTSVVGDPTF